MSTTPNTNQYTEEDYSTLYDSVRVPKRVSMACQFCRGRKLKCDGMRPSCANCHKRSFVCAYVAVTAQQTQQK